MEALWTLIHEGQVMAHREYQRRFQGSRETASNDLAGLVTHRLGGRWDTGSSTPDQAM